MLKQLAKKIDSIKDDQMLTPADIQELGVLIDSNLKPTRDVLYKLIRRGKLAAMNLGASDAKPQYAIQGSELKRFLRERYRIIEKSPAKAKRSVAV